MYRPYMYDKLRCIYCVYMHDKLLFYLRWGCIRNDLLIHIVLLLKLYKNYHKSLNVFLKHLFFNI